MSVSIVANAFMNPMTFLQSIFEEQHDLQKGYSLIYLMSVRKKTLQNGIKCLPLPFLVF